MQAEAYMEWCVTLPGYENQKCAKTGMEIFELPNPQSQKTPEGETRPAYRYEEEKKKKTLGRKY